MAVYDQLRGGARFEVIDGRVCIRMHQGVFDIHDAAIVQAMFQQDAVDVSTLGDPHRQFIGGHQRLTLEMELDLAIEKPVPARPPEKPQEPSREKKRLQLPQEGERRSGRRLGRPGGR